MRGWRNAWKPDQCRLGPACESGVWGRRVGGRRMRGAQARKLAKKAAKATKSVAKKAAQKQVAKAKKGVNAAQKVVKAKKAVNASERTVAAKVIKVMSVWQNSWLGVVRFHDRRG